MCLFKRKEYISREDVVNSICELEKDEINLENEVANITANINEMLQKGMMETDKNQKLFYAKKINYLKDDANRKSKRVLFLLYNIKLLTRLKESIDDNQLIQKVKGLYLTNMLTNQKELAIYLNKLLNTKLATEDVLTEADNLFTDIESKYEENNKIYGIESDSSEDALLSMFEMESTVNMENEIMDNGLVVNREIENND